MVHMWLIPGETSVAWGWINGGYFVIEPPFFDLIAGDKTMLERDPLEQAANSGELMAYHHDGFFHCMDTKRDQITRIFMAQGCLRLGSLYSRVLITGVWICWF